MRFSRVHARATPSCTRAIGGRVRRSAEQHEVHRMKSDARIASDRKQVPVGPVTSYRIQLYCTAVSSEQRPVSAVSCLLSRVSMLIPSRRARCVSCSIRRTDLTVRSELPPYRPSYRSYLLPDGTSSSRPTRHSSRVVTVCTHSRGSRHTFLQRARLFHRYQIR
jgi:hypothetical protein